MIPKLPTGRFFFSTTSSTIRIEIKSIQQPREIFLSLQSLIIKVVNKNIMTSDSLATKSYTELRRKILSNQLISGTRLKENDWARKLGVNRMAIREALMRLLGEGLVVSGKKGGYFIKSMTAYDVQEIRELRELLELGALRLAFQKIDEQHIEELEKICDDFISMVKGGYLGGACEADIKFHETIINCAGNGKLKEIYEISNIPLFHQKIGKAKSHLEDYEKTDFEHRQIVKALRTKNIELAEETIIRHLLRGEMTVLDLELSSSSGSYRE